MYTYINELHVDTCVYMYVSSFMYMHIYAGACTYVHIFQSKGVHVYMCVYTYILVYIQAYVHVCIHMCTYTHVCALWTYLALAVQPARIDDPALRADVVGELAIMRN